MGSPKSSKSRGVSCAENQRPQVAAICYRVRRGSIEFLLVRTRSGRWTFPKGGVETGLTSAQSAAMEAFEEAGVHGRMEKIAFTRYFNQTPERTEGDESVWVNPGIAAHLCEVTRLEAPQESNRNPTWFCAAKAKRRLAERRAVQFGLELERVVDRACARIERLQSAAEEETGHFVRDPLQTVHLENVRGAAPRLGLALATQAQLQLQLQLRRSVAEEAVRRPPLRLPAAPGKFRSLMPSETVRKPN